MHVAHIICSEGLYGAERWILALINAAKTYPFSQSLVNLTTGSAGTSEIVSKVRGSVVHAIDMDSRGRFNPTAGVALGRWVQANGIDILHTHGFKADAIGLIAARYSGRKILATPHGWSREQSFKLGLYEAFDRLLFHFVDAICPLSLDMSRQMLMNPFLKGKTSLILNGVDIDEVDSVTGAQRKNSGFVVGYIGQLITRKNVMLLLDVLRDLISLREDVSLALIGDGHLRIALERRASELGIDRHVTFYGFRPDAVKLLKTLDVLLLPSLLEGIPRCVMEAMAARIPVVVSDIPGNRDLVIHRETGMLFAPDSKAECLESIKFVMDNEHEVELMTANARVRIESDFSNHKMIRDYFRLYSSLVGKG